MIPKISLDRMVDLIEREVTMEEIVQLMKESQDDLIIHVEFGEAVDLDAKKE